MPTLSCQLASVRLELTTDDPELAAAIHSLLGAQGPSDRGVTHQHACQVLFHTGQVAGTTDRSQRATSWRVQDGAIQGHRDAEYQAWFEPAANQARVTIDPRANADVRAARLRERLSNSLRFLAGALLPNHGCLLLHASACAIDGMAQVFIGHSGSGKSTTARLLGDPILADDGIAVGRVATDAFAMAYPLPFEKLSPQARALGPLPVGNLYLLLGRRQPVLRPLSPAEAAMQLGSRVVFPELVGGEPLLGVLDLIAKAAPVHELGYDHGALSNNPLARDAFYRAVIRGAWDA